MLENIIMFYVINRIRIGWLIKRNLENEIEYIVFGLKFEVLGWCWVNFKNIRFYYKLFYLFGFWEVGKGG